MEEENRKRLEQAEQRTWRLLTEQLRESSWPEVRSQFGRFQEIRNARRGDVQDLPHDVPYLAYYPLLLSADGAFDDGACKIVVEVSAGPVDRVTSVQIFDARPPVLLCKVSQSALHGRREELAKTNAAADEFTAAVAAGDQPRIDRARRRFHQIHGRLNYVSEVFLDRLRHPDAEVRRRLLMLFASPEAWKAGQYETDAVAIVVRVVEDEEEEIEVRRAAVRVLLNWGKCQELTQAMRPLGDRSELVPAITAFILDENSPGAASSVVLPPTGYAELIAALPDLTDDPHDIIPALIALLDDPRPWTEVVPAAARALGQLGPVAHDAIPALREAAASQYGSVRVAAEEAIRQIQESSTEASTDARSD